MGVSAAINGGTLYTPYIVKSISEPTINQIIKENKPIKKRTVISEETSKTVRYALESVVAKGSGRNAFINGYRVGGKTGTAQKVKDGRYMDGNYILSFIGFMPADNPKVVVYVAIDNPKGVVQYGGTVAAPIAKNVLKSCIDILDISSSKTGLEREYELWDIKYYEVPNLVGLTKEEARKKVNPLFKIEYSGNGNKVIKQSPIENSYIKQGDTIRVMLN